MTLSDLSVNRAVMATMFIAAIVVFGIIGYSRLGISQYPDVEFPVVSVTTTLTGAAPEVMETDVTDILEEEINTVEGIRSLTSMSFLGISLIQVEFELTRDIDFAVQDVRDKVGVVMRDLPEDIDPPVIQKVNPQDMPIMWLSLYGQRPLQEITEFAKDFLGRNLQTIPGVGSIMIGGRRERTIRVWLDARRMEGHGLTVDEVAAALARENVEIPGGNIEGESIEFQVKTEGEVPVAEGFAGLTVTYRNGDPIRIRDVGWVEDGLEDKRSLARFNRIPSVGLGVRKQRGANTVAVARAVKETLERLRPQIPSGLQVDIPYDSSLFIEEAIREIQFALIVAVILTALVTFFFLRSVRSTFIIFLAIPTSLIGTFAFMYFLGFTLNTLTLLGLTLSVGLVVDDAIIVLENIYRHRERGEGKRDAAVNGAREITFAAIAATLSIAAVFIPVAFMRGVVGRFFFEFGMSVAIAIMLSLFVALSLTPMLCSRILEIRARGGALSRGIEGLLDGLSRIYTFVLGRALGARWAVVGAAVAVLIGSTQLLAVIGKEFVPSEDQSRMVVFLETPVGSSIEYTDGVLRRCEDWFANRPEVARFFGAIGIHAERAVNKGLMFITLVPARERRLSQQEFVRVARKALMVIPGTKISFLDLSQIAFSAQAGFPIEFAIQGPSLAELEGHGQEIMAGMRSIPGVVDVDWDYDKGQPEVRVVPDRDRAADVGIDVAAIGRTVGYLVGGREVTRFTYKGKRYEVRVRLMADQRRSPSDVAELQVRTGKGGLVRLKDVAQVDEAASLQIINRRDRERTINIRAGLAPGKPQAEALRQVTDILGKALKEPYHFVLSGSAEAFRESFLSLIFALGMAVLFTFMVLASQFNSLIHPFTVMTAIPFSMVGAILILTLTGETLNLYSFIGLILLQGIVVKNSILLVEFANHARDAGASPRDAMMRAASVRLRPILMTAVSTTLGAVPVALKLGPGAESRAPMGIAVVGGVTLSTVLTLIVVPCLYTIVDDARGFLARRFARVEESEIGQRARP